MKKKMRIFLGFLIVAGIITFGIICDNRGNDYTEYQTESEISIPTTTPLQSPTYTPSSSNSSSKKLCAATPCPNTATSGSYCDIHAKGKTNKCLDCGKAIWSDETWCDDCLFGAFSK